MLCEAFSAFVYSSSCHLASFFVFSISFRKLNEVLFRFRSCDDLANHCAFHFLILKKTWIAFVVRFGSLFTCTVDCFLMNFQGLGWIWAGSIVHICPAASASCYVISKYQWTSSTGSHKWPLYTDEVVCIRSCAGPSILQSSHIIPQVVDLHFICP